jgi:hypothetical protein
LIHERVVFQKGRADGRGQKNHVRCSQVFLEKLGNRAGKPYVSHVIEPYHEHASRFCRGWFFTRYKLKKKAAKKIKDRHEDGKLLAFERIFHKSTIVIAGSQATKSFGCAQDGEHVEPQSPSKSEIATRLWRSQ